jgi:hypothetical protein
MADDSFVITVAGAVVTTVISVVILRSLKYFERKQETKAEEVKQTAKDAAEAARLQHQQIAEELTRKNEERAQITKENASIMAEELRKDNIRRDEDIAKNIANNAERIRQEQMTQSKQISENLKATTSKIALDLENKTDSTSKAILSNISDVDKRLTRMIDSLQRGAELTNGNVSKIRSDILELQDDVDNIYDKINKDELQINPQKKMERERKRKIRKREISNDSILQDPKTLWDTRIPSVRKHQDQQQVRYDEEAEEAAEADT